MTFSKVRFAAESGGIAALTEKAPQASFHFLQHFLCELVSGAVREPGLRDRLGGFFVPLVGSRAEGWTEE